MTMWADNIKFVKEIIDSKYSKIDNAVAEVKNNNRISKVDQWESVKQAGAELCQAQTSLS